MTVRPGVEIASLTDLGCQRDNNEDSFAYWEGDDDAAFHRLGRLAIVADGMGGAEGGQHASRIAVETVLEEYGGAVPPDDPQQALIHAFAEANVRVQRAAMESPGLHGMGTTLTAFALVSHRLYYAHIGDSRLYQLRNGQLRQLTHDHSLVARLVENGVVRAEDAEKHPQKHVLTAAVGVSDSVQPDAPANPVAVQSGDVFLLCTDGLWGQMNDAEMIRVLTSKAPAGACRALVELAKQRGGPDNITLQIARVA
jgi:serine/threonine protein phosphatase PrpC